MASNSRELLRQMVSRRLLSLVITRTIQLKVVGIGAAAAGGSGADATSLLRFSQSRMVSSVVMRLASAVRPRMARILSGHGGMRSATDLHISQLTASMSSA